MEDISENGIKEMLLFSNEGERAERNKKKNGNILSSGNCLGVWEKHNVIVISASLASLASPAVGHWPSVGRPCAIKHR